MRQKRMRSEPVPELFPLTGEELCENVFEVLIDLFASPGSEHCEDSRVSSGSEHCEDSRVSDGSEHAFNRANQKEWASWLDEEAVELVKDRLKVPRSHILRTRWMVTWKNVGTEKVPKARLCALGFSGSSFDHTSHIIFDSYI